MTRHRPEKSVPPTESGGACEFRAAPKNKQSKPVEDHPIIHHPSSHVMGICHLITCIYIYIIMIYDYIHNYGNNGEYWTYTACIMLI